MNINTIGRKCGLLAGLLAVSGWMCAQEKVEPILFGNMDQWVVRKIEESGIIGGNTKTIYEVGPSRTIEGRTAYTNLGGSPWGSSNVMAKVSGIVKTNCSVYPDQHGKGRCAKLLTHTESVKVLGIINIKVLAAGSLFLGDMMEPITSTEDGPKNMNWGIPFSKRPKAIRYDYKATLTGNGQRIRQTGFSRVKTVAGQDCAVTTLLLQQRKEDADGRITALRVGTMVVKYDRSVPNWVNGATYEIHYGDIRQMKGYDEATMGLRRDIYARNSRGESVLVEETGWAPANAKPTHLGLQFTSSHGGAYVGAPGNTFWVDNVALVY